MEAILSEIGVSYSEVEAVCQSLIQLIRRYYFPRLFTVSKFPRLGMFVKFAFDGSLLKGLM